MNPKQIFLHAPRTEEEENDDEFLDGNDEHKLDRCQMFFKFSSIYAKMIRQS
jgi:hypothetical protein